MHAWFSTDAYGYILSYWTSDFLHFPSSKIVGEGFTTETCIEENCCGVEKKPVPEEDCYDSFSVAVMKFTCNKNFSNI